MDDMGAMGSAMSVAGAILILVSAALVKYVFFR